MSDEFRELRALLMTAQRAPGEPPPSGVSASGIETMESELHCRLPNALKDWLMIVNGSCVGGGGIVGINKTNEMLDMQDTLELYPHWKENQWYPVACDGSGNYFVVVVLGDGTCPVAFIDVSEDSWELTYLVASNIKVFIRRFIEKECGTNGWPFDKTKVLKQDPDLASLESAPLPWECD